jgi:hypothetical protein
VIRDDLAPSMRLKVLGVGLAFAAGGLLAFWFGWSGVTPLLRSLDQADPVIAFRPSDLIGFPIAVALFAFAVMCLIRVPQDGAGGHRRRPGDTRTWRAATILLGVAAIGCILAVAIAPIGRAVVSGMVADHGYLPCPEPKQYQRHPPLRWHLPAGECP